MARDYMKLMQQDVPLFSFGGEGSGDGQLSRPWGICCDKWGRILVADRSNNRIQVFGPGGEFAMKFGKKGVEPGEFNRPAGIAVNSKNHIIVADKDNHRVQAFNDSGNFLFAFGSSGRQVGMFNYPWDVACNSLDQIAVTDTRNHRIQIFNKFGQFLRKCTFQGNFIGKSIYSPRGVVWLSNECLAVTDFNTHSIAVLNIKKQIVDVTFYGNEGHEPGKFFRPQGICVDSLNNLLITDSRCNRIQVVAPSNMRVMGMIVGSMDRPCDVCIGLNGYVYIVDFGANCVRVY